MPWAVEQAGLVAGLSLILVMAALCFYTAYCILQVYGVYGRLSHHILTLRQMVKSVLKQVKRRVFPTFPIFACSYWAVSAS